MKLVWLLFLTVFGQLSPETYYIDLDQPPRLRFNQLTSDKKQDITNFINMLRGNQLYQASFAFAKYLNKNLTHLIDTEFYEECDGIAQTLGLPVWELVVFNYMYELGAFSDFCTSVAMNTNKGQTILGRNLDYGFQKYLANSSVQLIYRRQGKEIYRIAGHAGFNGGHTFMRSGSYSLTMNERIDGGLRQTLTTMLNGCKQVSFMMRKTVENCPDVQCAYEALRSQKICAPVYFTLASPELSVVIERTRQDVHAVYRLPNRENTFIVQTNTDRDRPDPDHRRTLAQQRLSNFTSLTQDALHSVLLQYPNFNPLTLMTVMMNPRSSSMNITVWH